MPQRAQPDSDDESQRQAALSASNASTRAIGGTACDTASSGAAKEWATETSGTVDTSEYSSEMRRGYQTGTAETAKTAAETAKDTAVSGEYSAKHYSAKAAASAKRLRRQCYLPAKHVVSTNADVATNADAAHLSHSRILRKLPLPPPRRLRPAPVQPTRRQGIDHGDDLGVRGIDQCHQCCDICHGCGCITDCLSIDGTSVVISHVATAAGSGAAVTFQGYLSMAAFKTSDPIDGQRQWGAYGWRSVL